MKFDVPQFLKDHQIFRVKPDTYYHIHYGSRLDEHGNISASILMSESLFAVWCPAIVNRELVEVTDNPGKKIDWNPPPPPPPKWKADLAKRTKENADTRKQEREAPEKAKEIEKPKRGRPKGSTNRKTQTGGKK